MWNMLLPEWSARLGDRGRERGIRGFIGICSGLLRHNGHRRAIQHVAIDRSAANIKGMSDNFENSRVVYDMFNVAYNVVEACEQERVWLTIGRRRESRPVGANTRVLLKNRIDWTEKEAQNWKLMAYKVRVAFQGIYGWKDTGVDRKIFGNGCAWVQAMREQIGEVLEPMTRAARMIERHLEGILAHWT